MYRETCLNCSYYSSEAQGTALLVQPGIKLTVLPVQTQIVDAD
jgi:hypothetical protein